MIAYNFMTRYFHKEIIPCNLQSHVLDTIRLLINVGNSKFVFQYMISFNLW